MEDVTGEEVSDPERITVENLTAQEVADAVWLATHWHATVESATADEPTGPSLPDPGPDGDGAWPLTPPGISAPEPAGPENLVAVPRPTPGPDPSRQPSMRFDRPGAAARLALDKGIPGGLRPLRQTVPSVRERVLDEQATAEHSLVDPRWIPFFKPAEERRWDVVLVVDDNPSMALWEFATRAFAELLARQGAFRNVSHRLLCLDEKLGCSLRGTAPGAPRHGISELLLPTDRRIVIVVTDGVAGAWRSGVGLSVLARWAHSLPVALVHLLPWSSWRNTGLNVHRLAFQAPTPGVPNRSLAWRAQSAPARHLYADLSELIPVPVLGLGGRWFRPWARLVSGNMPGWTNLPGLLLTPLPDGRLNPTARPPVDAGRRIADFRATVSPTTFELGTYLAATPLDLALAREVQNTLLPHSHLVHLSEFLACGPVELIEPVGEGPMRICYEFESGTRQELLAAGRRFATAEVLRVVDRRVDEARALGTDLDKPSHRSGSGSATNLNETISAARMAALDAIRTNPLSNPRGQNYPDVRSNPPFGGTHGMSFAPVHLSPPIAYGQDRDIGGAEVSVTADPGMGEQWTRAGSALGVWGGVPPRNSNFTGREELLQQLHEALQPGAMTAVVPHALHGLGGVGKSQLAVEYAYRHRADFDVIWWIPAELPVQIQSSLAELGQRLDLGVPNEANVAVGIVMDALKGSVRGGRRVPSNWLLVFDNAEDPEIVLPYLPTGGPGRILVTSRNSQWLNLARPLEVDVFERGESIELLQRRGPDLSYEDADRLAEALGDLPLAIEQAAAWRAETGMPADEYIQALTEKEAEVLALPGPLDYQRSVAAAWNLSLDKLEASNPTALRLLQVCAFFAADPIPRTMFANARGVRVDSDLDRALHDRLRLNEAIRDVNRLALAKIDHRINSIQMHRLVQAVLKHQMSPDEQSTMRHGAHLLLAANDPNNPDNADQWPKYGQLYPHVVASNAIECDDSGARELLYNQAQFLYFWGEHSASLEMSQQIYDTWLDKLGADNPETLKIGRWLGFMLWLAGRFQEAAAFNAELLEVHRRTLGDDHEDTIDAINSVTGDRRAQGDFSGALELTRANYQRCIQRFGDDDPLTLNAAHNLGVSLRLSGRFGEALELDQATWARKVAAYGTDHPLSMITQVGLTIDLRELGDYLAASTQHEDIVARYRAVHGPLNPATLAAIAHQAAMRRKAGDHEGAATAADEAFEGLLTRYGPDNPATVAALLTRSISVRLAEDFAEARRVGQEVFDRYRRTLGEDHPHTLSARTILAISCRLVGEPEQAREHNQAALEGFRSRLGEDHPSTMVASINLASDLFALGEIQAAYDLDATTLTQAERVLVRDHPTTLACKANLAHDLRALGRQDEGTSLRYDVIVRTRDRLGPNHPAVALFTDPNLRADCDIDPIPL